MASTGLTDIDYATMELRILCAGVDKELGVKLDFRKLQALFDSITEGQKAALREAFYGGGMTKNKAQALRFILEHGNFDEFEEVLRALDV